MTIKARHESEEAKKQTAVEFLRETGHLSKEEVEFIIRKVQSHGEKAAALSRLPYSPTTTPDSPTDRAIVCIDEDFIVTRTMGQNIEKMGFTSSEIEGKSVRETAEELLHEILIPTIQEVVKGQEKEFIYSLHDRHYRATACPVDFKEQVFGAVLVIRDITDFIHQKLQLDLLYKAVETSDEMVVITDAKEKIGEEKILFVNRGFEKTTGYSRDEVLGKNPRILQGPDTEPAVLRNLVEHLSQGKRFEGETFNYRKDGSRFRLFWSITPVRDETGTITHFVSVQRDVTEYWEQQRHLEEMIADREAVLKEIHHRIKNNLAVVSGLLELQLLQNPSAEVQDVLYQSINRIKSIAILHETLYKTESFRDIELSTYFTEIAVQATNALVRAGKEISIETDIAPIRVSDIQAMPCGLILNEVITNSTKHAFKDKTTCIIRVVAKELKGEVLKIVISDNGCGLPEGFNPADADTLGMSLIEALCQQLGAKYAFETSDKGTTFTMEFTPQSQK
jgi:PAS domain S-box-containing protein